MMNFSPPCVLHITSILPRNIHPLQVILMKNSNYGEPNCVIFHYPPVTSSLLSVLVKVLFSGTVNLRSPLNVRDTCTKQQMKSYVLICTFLDRTQKDKRF
jgi:hypothetical protein